MSKNQPLVIGHRGAASIAPENTWASFRTAIEEGADGIELDIHLSADGKLIVIHDDTVDRTTDGSGEVWKMTAEELRKLDAGAWFDERFRGERLPLLEEVFALVPPGLLINIEIKGSYGGKLEEELSRMLDAEGRSHRVVVSSFDHKILQRLKRLRPATAIGLLYSANPVTHLGLTTGMQGEVTSFHPHHRLIGESDITELRRAGYAVYPYTPNREEDWRRLVRAGASGIITDRPGELRELLRREAGDLG